MIAVIIVIIAAGVTGVGLLKGWFSSEGTAFATASQVTGIVNVERDGVSFELKEGDAIRSGDRISTGTKAEIKIISGNNSVALSEESVVSLKDDDGRLTADIESGEAFFTADERKTFGTVSAGGTDLSAGENDGAEPWTQGMRDKIEAGLGIRAHDIYGLSEVMGPGVSTSCEENNGMHIQEDFFYVEIIDPDTLEPVADGEKGELVITTLGKEGMPLIRYRTRDICYLMREKCACGRTTARMSRVFGRTDDMLIIRGVNVFPSQVETVIAKFDKELTMNYKLYVGREHNTDTFELAVELAEGLAIDDIGFVEALRGRVEHALRDILGIGCKVRLLNEGTLPRSEGKAVRVEDTRKL